MLAFAQVWQRRLLAYAGPDGGGRPGPRGDPDRQPGGRLGHPRRADRAAHRAFLIGDTYGVDGPPLPASEFDEVEWVAFDTEVLPAQVPAWKGFARLLATGDFSVVAEGGGVIVAQRVEP